MAVMPERNVAMKVQRQDHYASVGTAAPYLLKNIKLSLYNVSNSSEFLVKLYYILEQSKGTIFPSALQRRTLPIKSIKQLLKIFQMHIVNIQGNCDYIYERITEVLFMKS
jgi:hypothetical protein